MANIILDMCLFIPKDPISVINKWSVSLVVNSGITDLTSIDQV